MGHHENDTRDKQRESQREETVAKRTHTLEEGPVCVCVGGGGACVVGVGVCMTLCVYSAYTCTPLYCCHGSYLTYTYTYMYSDDGDPQYT